MPLNTQQVQFCNEVYRPFVEKMIAALAGSGVYLQAFTDVQASPDAFTIDTAILDDAGGAPRDDAPNITGQDLQDLFDHMAAINAIMTNQQKQTLRNKAVRSLTSILR